MKTFEIKAGNEIRSNVCALNHAVNIRVIAWLVLKKEDEIRKQRGRPRLVIESWPLNYQFSFTLKFRGSS